MTPAQTLRDAAELLSKPGAWIQEDFARKADGSPTLSWMPYAVCWCLQGAIRHAAGGPNSLSWAAERAVCRVLGDMPGRGTLNDWNDVHGRTADEVRGVLIAAAESLERARVDA